jgi:transcriptional regulator with XRE-family HTH domain
VSITDAGLTDHQLARLLDVSPSYIYKIKTGRSEPSLRLRRRLFQVFGRDDLIAVLDSMTGRRP